MCYFILFFFTLILSPLLANDNDSTPSQLLLLLQFSLDSIETNINKKFTGLLSLNINGESTNFFKKSHTNTTNIAPPLSSSDIETAIRLTPDLKNYTYIIKDGDIKFNQNTNTVSNILEYTVPLKIKRYQIVNLFFLKFTLKYETRITAKFQMNSNIREQWSLSTKTQASFVYNSYPRLSVYNSKWKIPFFKFGKKSIQKNLDKYCVNIDEQVPEIIQVEKKIAEIWKMLNQSVVIDRQYNLWLQSKIKNIWVEDITYQNRKIIIPLEIYGDLEAFMGNPPKTRVSYMPNPILSGKKIESELKVRTKFTLKEIADILKIAYLDKNSIAETRNKTKIYVKNLSLSTTNQLSDTVILANGRFDTENEVLNRLENTAFSLTGILDYNTNKNYLSLNDIEYSLSNATLLTWLGNVIRRSKIKSDLERSLAFDIEKYNSFFRKEIQKKLKSYSINKEITLKTKITDLDIQFHGIDIREEVIENVFVLKGDFYLDIEL